MDQIDSMFQLKSKKSTETRGNWRAEVPKQSTLSKMGNCKLRKQRENDKLDALRSIFIQSFIYIYIYIFIYMSLICKDEL